VNGFHDEVKAIRISTNRMRSVKAMYRRGNILARTIFGFGCWRTFFLTHLGSKFSLGPALITETYLRN
jgi:hypothetical protein